MPEYRKAEGQIWIRMEDVDNKWPVNFIRDHMVALKKYIYMMIYDYLQSCVRR